MGKLWTPKPKLWKPSRRAFLRGLGASIAAPYVAKAQFNQGQSVGSAGFGNAQSSGGGGYVGPLDLVSGAAVAFSVARALSSAMRGQPLHTLREAGGDTTQEFSSDVVTGESPNALIMAFLNGARGFYTSISDQSGNARNATQATASLQAEWLANQINSKPSICATSETDTATYTLPSATYASGAATFFSVSRYNGAEFFAQDTTPYLDFQPGPGVYIDMYDGTNEAGGTFDDTAFPEDDFILYEAVVEFGATTILANGTVLMETTNYDFGGAPDAITAAAGLFFGVSFGGDIGSEAESLVYPMALSSGDRTPVRQNIAAYYGITLA